MAKPTMKGWKQSKRLVRDLIMNPITILEYPLQSRESELEGFSDSDWAGCRRTGKSTSGGVIKIGEHFLNAWSKTQSIIALSSAESEHTICLTK